MKELHLNPTSRSSATTDDLELRKTKTTRLVFRPLVVENPRDARASVKGDLIFQKKGRNDAWEDHNELSLNRLKAEEWVKLSLKSGEILDLFLHLWQLYKIHTDEGIPKVRKRYVQVGDELAAVLDSSKETLTRYLRANEEVGLDVFLRLLDWLAEFGNPGKVVARLEQLETETLEQLSAAVGVSALRKVLAEWRDNRGSSDEEYWQAFLLRNRFVLSHVFTYPVLIVEDKAYVGGKTFDRKGGRFLDFLMANSLTRNALLLEIKTPASPLLKGEYRGVPLASRDLVGAVGQVMRYKQEMLGSFSQLADEEDVEKIAPFYPRCSVLIGDTAQLGNTQDQQAFETYRNGLREVEILTYDELFARVEGVLEALTTGI